VADDEQDVEDMAFLDLGDYVHVVYQDKVNDQMRVERVSHSITPDRWTVTYAFDALDGVAQPTWTPSPVTATGVADGVWYTPTLTNSWSNYGAPYATAQYMRKNGIVYLKGLVRSGTLNATILTLPAGYRPADAHLFNGISNFKTTGAASAGTAHTHAVADVAVRININADGTVSCGASLAGNGYISLSGISFVAEA
jgi:hypothetical protein